MRRVSIIITVALLICLFGTCAYFVGGVSATIPPIRIYNFNGSVNQLGNSIQSLSSFNNRISVKISRRDSSALDNGFRDMVILIKRDIAIIEYDLVCEQAESKNKSKSTIKLTMAYDKTNNIGGYGIKAPGAKDLLNYFEKTFLVELKAKQGLVLQPDTSFWDNFSIY